MEHHRYAQLFRPTTAETKIVLSKLPNLNNESGRQLVEKMIATAGLTRNGFRAGDLSTVMSLRAVLRLGRKHQIFDDLATAFRLSFLNRCEDEEKNWLLKSISVALWWRFRNAYSKLNPLQVVNHGQCFFSAEKDPRSWRVCRQSNQRWVESELSRRTSL